MDPLARRLADRIHDSLVNAVGQEGPVVSWGPIIEDLARATVSAWMQGQVPGFSADEMRACETLRRMVVRANPTLRGGWSYESVAGRWLRDEFDHLRKTNHLLSDLVMGGDES